MADQKVFPSSAHPLLGYTHHPPPSLRSTGIQLRHRHALPFLFLSGSRWHQPGLCCVPTFNSIAPTHCLFFRIPLQIIYPPEIYSCLRCLSTFDIPTFPFSISTQPRGQSSLNQPSPRYVYGTAPIFFWGLPACRSGTLWAIYLFTCWHFQGRGLCLQSSSGLCSGPTPSLFSILSQPFHSSNVYLGRTWAA